MRKRNRVAAMLFATSGARHLLLLRRRRLGDAQSSGEPASHRAPNHRAPRALRSSRALKTRRPAPAINHESDKAAAPLMGPKVRRQQQPGARGPRAEANPGRAHPFFSSRACK